MKVLGIITARGGSKGIPGKNLKLLAGKPLLAYTIDTARRSGALDRVILSTEDEAIATAGRDLGCDVPFIRPLDLAHDDTPHLPVIQHATRWMQERVNYRPDAVMILQPTSPLRTAAGHRRGRGAARHLRRGFRPQRERSPGALASDADAAPR